MIFLFNLIILETKNGFKPSHCSIPFNNFRNDSFILLKEKKTLIYINLASSLSFFHLFSINLYFIFYKSNMHLLNRMLIVALITGCSSDQSKVECTKVDTQMATVLIDCTPEILRSDCINANINSLIRSDEYKKNTLIKFNASEDDAEVKDFLISLSSKKDRENSNFMNLSALDVAFKKDRELGHIYIYKILDLMDRNYDISNLSDDKLSQLTAKSKEICQKR